MRLIDADALQKAIPAEEDNITGMGMTYDEMEAYNDGIDEQWKKIINAPTIEPERLTDDDFETIRIHLNAYKENLCNQQRWKEAEEYQRIIDRFMAFVSAERKKGKWIFIHPLQADDEGAYICSNCRHGDWDIKPTDKYCKFCGADMRGEEE